MRVLQVHQIFPEFCEQHECLPCSQKITTRKPGGFMQSCVFPCIVKFLVHLLQYLKDTINIIPQTTTKYVVLYENWVSQI